MKEFFLSIIVLLLKTKAYNVIIDNKQPIIKKSKLGLGLIPLSFFCFLLSLIFLSLSGYNYFLLYYNSSLSALLISLIALMVCLICIGIAQFLLKRNVSSPLHETNTENFIDIVTSSISKKLIKPIQEKPKTALVLASLLGFLLMNNKHH